MCWRHKNVAAPETHHELPYSIDWPVLQKDEFLRLIINSIRNDLISRNEAFQCLALGFIGNGQFVDAFISA